MHHVNNLKKLLWKVLFSITILFAILTISLNGSAQVSPSSFKVSGKIVDASGITVPGATITEKGTKTATASEKDGSFSLPVSGSKAVLAISFIGYENKEVNVNGKKFLDVKLQLSANELSQVVVVGYGTQRKGEVTSAITSLKAEDFNKGNISDPVGLL